MSDRQWTRPQEHSITAHGGSLLISAAAGSGKTAVLVERILRRITAAENPVDVDRLLVVTFTRAAAAEMRQRLSAALAQKMAAEPHNPLYQRQQLLLPQASITTVHGFCTKLLRGQAGRAGLPPRFTVAEESEAALLASQALDEIFEEAYTRRDAGFMALATTLNGKRDDSGLREAVQQAYTFMQAQPFPQRWLREQIDAYTAVQPLENTRWVVPLLREMDFTLEAVAQRLRRLADMAVRCGIGPYAEHLTMEAMQVDDLRARLKTGTFDERCEAVSGFVFTRIPPVKAVDAVQDEVKEIVKSQRGALKKRVAALGGLFYGGEMQVRTELAALAPMAEALGELVTAYAARFTALKREKKLLDYNDLEHESVRLLIDEATGEHTRLAQELSMQFDEIMVDEYQDTNAVQDMLFRALSRQQQNLFMVGDVKQSIYGFRQAMPEIFTRRRDTYTPYDEQAPAFPATITLENNFRSRETVTDTVNFLFRQLMQRTLGGVDYDEREALVYSAQYSSADGCETEWLLLDKSLAEEECPANEIAEARLIARRIQQQMATMRVTTRDGSRPLEYGDICILLRSHRPMATYIKEFARYGIPAGAQGSGTFFATPEISTALALLRCVDNPLREVELTALMLSPLYGFTADDCARLRILTRQKKQTVPLYAAMEQVASGAWSADERLMQLCGRLLGDLRRFRVLAVSLPADRLIERLYRETAITAVFSARAGGRQRVANLHQLDRVARDFSQDGFRGLTAFVRYIDRLQEQGKDLAAGNSIGGNSVKLMTVHGSKGLEYPVVYLARMGGQFNREDAKQKLLFHHHVGIGLCRHDSAAQMKGRTLPFAGVLSARRQDERAEELRVWYVAMTRAREKLCIVLTVNDLTTKLGALELTLPASRLLLPDTLLSANGPADWFLAAALRHPSFAAFRQDSQTTVTMAAGQPWAVTVVNPAELGEEHITDADTVQVAADDRLTAILRERAAYAYPYAALRGVPAKLAASQLSHESMSREHIAKTVPAFLQKEGMTAAQKGTALHTFMQFADYARAAADVAAEAARLTDAGFLTAAQKQVLPLDKLKNFFASDLYVRMCASADCRREFHFTVRVPADAVAEQPTGFTDEQVVVQGIADCVFREGDGLVLVDYKTDRVSSAQELADRYRSQLQFYRWALEPIFELPVTEAVLYSFHLGDTVTVKV